MSPTRSTDKEEEKRKKRHLILHTSGTMLSVYVQLTGPKETR